MRETFPLSACSEQQHSAVCRLDAKRDTGERAPVRPAEGGILPRRPQLMFETREPAQLPRPVAFRPAEARRHAIASFAGGVLPA